MSSVFFNKGENCIAAGRLFVEEGIHDQFVKKVVCVSLCLLFNSLLTINHSQSQETEAIFIQIF